MIKDGVRSIGIDDGPFRRAGQREVLVVGAIYRGGTCFDGLLSCKVRRDGWNATQNLVEMIGNSKFLPQLHYLLLDGIALGGFNILDLDRLHRELGLKVLVAVRQKPDLKSVRRALNNLSKPQKRWRLIQAGGPIHKIGAIHCQLKGLDIPEAKDLLGLTCTRSNLPEPLRAAHLIAGGLVRGQSGKRA